MSKPTGCPDVLVLGEDGKVYYAPGSSFKALKVDSNHPIHGKLQHSHAAPGSRPTITGEFAQESFVLADGQAPHQ